MAIFENNIDINSLINISQGGVQVARFDEVRDTLIRSMRNIYGTDIDISPASADGQWVNQIALIINNCLQVIKYSYDMLDPASSTGKYLDILCSFNNIQRLMPTASTAQIWVKNISGIPQNDVKSIQFVDKNGLYWQWDNEKDVSLNYKTTWNVDEEHLLTNVKCLTLGPVVARGTGTVPNSEIWSTLREEDSGDIYQSVEFAKWKVYQASDAQQGNEYETDESLRSRRIQSLGNQSVSVLSGLRGSLLTIDGVQDVYVLNNPSTTIAEDDTYCDEHTVYICIRYKEGVSTDSTKRVIGEMIYNKLTPGIPTVGLSNTQTHTTKNGVEVEYDIQKTLVTQYPIKWKRCVPLEVSNKTITLTCNNLVNKYDFPTNPSDPNRDLTSTEKRIANNIINYLNNIRLGDRINSNSLLSEVQKADILKNGFNTFFVNSTTFSSSDAMNLSYFNISTSNISFSYTDISGDDNHKLCTITINYSNPS